MTELALPAGSLQSALVAFQEGADAVYLGLKEYSARKSAVNFSFEDYAKILLYARAHGKKVYVTVNTIIDEKDLLGVARLLRHLSLLGCDGVIVQDLGVARIIRLQFPSLPLHGSTQLAVHTIDGVKQMQKFGFTRVVLARELTINEIKKIRLACPDVEIKVFIHGALCYSVSGLCFASYYLTGRSANGGACAQICRTWFTDEQKKENGWFFSMRDLNAGGTVRLLSQMGIDSVKVEGRMKSPEYVGAVTRAYRKLLDGEDAEKEIENMNKIFSRSSYGGWLAKYGRSKYQEERKSESLISPEYPSHRGLPSGVIMGSCQMQGKLQLEVQLEKEISLHDGLMYLVKDEDAPRKAIKFALSYMSDQYCSSLAHATSGKRVNIVVMGKNPQPSDGSTLYVISSHDQHLKKINENIPMSKIAIDMTITLDQTGLCVTTKNCGFYLAEHYDLPVSRARTKQKDWSQKIPSLFSKSDRSLVVATQISFINQSGLDDQDLFLPVSVLKSIRRDWYHKADAKLEEYLACSIELVPYQKKMCSSLPPRAQLMTKEGLPFFTHIPLDVEDLISVDGFLYVPLSPVVFDEANEKKRLSTLLHKLEISGMSNRVRFGLNNICHIHWLQDCDVNVFIDFYLYIGNSEAAMQLMENVAHFDGGYSFIEERQLDTSQWPFEPTYIEDSFVPPLFISRACYKHDSLGLSCEGCKRNYTYELTQNDHRYHVLVKDCITYLLKD